MLTRLTLENFMAHGHTVIDFSEGMTVLSGPNNTGKSAVVEALRCLASNPTPKHVIRHGADRARVEAEFSDGTRVAWVRTPRWAAYEIFAPGAEEPEEYHKLNRKVPEDVAKILRLDPVTLEGGEEIDVHMGNQREPIFLLNRPPSAMASFFAASTEGAHLIAMQKALTARTRDKKWEASRLEASVRDAEAGLDALEGLPEVSLHSARAAELAEDIEEVRAELPRLERAAGDIRALRRDTSLQAERLKELGRAEPPPAPWDTPSLARLLATRARVKAELAASSRRAASLAPLAGPPVAAPTAPLARLAADISAARAARAGARHRSAALTGLETPPPDRGPAEATALANLLVRRRALVRHIDFIRQSGESLRELAPPPEPQDLSHLAESAGRLADRRRERDALARNLNALSQAIAAKREEIAAALAEIGVCPTCGQHLSEEAFLKGAHGHGTS